MEEASDPPPPSAPEQPGEPPDPRGPAWRSPRTWVRWLRGIDRRWRLLAVALAVPLLALSALAGTVWSRCGWRGCPSVDRLRAYQPGKASRLLDRRGRPFGELRPVEGETVPLARIPKHVRDAFLAVEDQRFFGHGGVDWRRTLGAALANLRSRAVSEGFSTITMQLARNVFPDRLPARERTLRRKLLEMRVAYEIESRFEKDEILELYLSHIYFGDGARGIAAASRHYFGVPPDRLTQAQAALLAALPKAPTHYDPRRHPDPAKVRRDLVLTLMEQQGLLDAPAAAAARAAPLGVVRRRGPAGTPPGLAAYFNEEVRREVEEQIGERLYDETLSITTTLDTDLQRPAEEELERQLRAIEAGTLGRFRGPRYSAADPADDQDTPYLQGAIVALESATGDVLAWVGGRDFRQSRFDRVRASRRQTGSSFKPFVYAAALKKGRYLSEHLADEPIRIELSRTRFWEPKNYDGEYEGVVTMREALVRSRNIPTVLLAEAVGPTEVAAFAREAGIRSEIDPTPALALGTVAVSPLELATAYEGFSTLGRAAAPRLVLRVAAEDGSELWKAEPPRAEPVLDPGVAYLVTNVLEEAIRRGTGAAVRALGFAGPAAGKTGTTNDATDTWFVGYTPEVVAAVWMGFDEPRPIMGQATGGRLAAPVWARMMMRAGRPAPPPWKAPSKVAQAWVDPESGLPLAEGCHPLYAEAYRELFLRGRQPQAVCPGRDEVRRADEEWPSSDQGAEEAREWARKELRRLRRERERTEEERREAEEELREAREEARREIRKERERELKEWRKETERRRKEAEKERKRRREYEG